VGVSGSSRTRAIGRQYDLFQASLESLGKQRKFLNYGYTVSGGQTYEERQERLCIEVFQAADIRKGDVVLDVGFGSGEQDFLLARTCEFGRLIGINISERQVQYASRRAREEDLAGKLSFHLGEAEVLHCIEASSVDRVLAIECAFYFDRPRFYRQAAEALKPGGLAVLADISLSDRLAFLTRPGADLQRLGTRASNRKEWEKYFITRSLRSINAWTWPGAQMTVMQILRVVPFSGFSGAELWEWIKMAFFSQLVALGLRLGLVRYDLIVLQKRSSAPH
jgi:cyclopropane fatty-acyl-phospholipid synthase-like methyltransferase